MHLKVGELARSTGLTVRTLHHYDEIGLLKPSGRSESGYRLYAEADVARLHAIRALRHRACPSPRSARCSMAARRRRSASSNSRCMRSSARSARPTNCVSGWR
ncbi:MerR family transcriptional regulator [Ramlibacter terrae]|uniref:MerR family transcriptional regulator n=1 Tax=Ramlibacter terrae TaxID=2732511 RepID=A0ABX6NZW3_9BURK|nr:MerR family transcriptional regulator [Ramlibacter terrae]